jgi:hypothetical protein
VIPMQFVFRMSVGVALLGAVGSGLSGCSTVSSVRTPRGQDRPVLSLEGPSGVPSDLRVGPKSVNVGKVVVQGVALENTNFDYPFVINSSVLKWVDYFTGRGRKHFARYLERSELFIPYIQPILRQHGMPEDLVYLAMIESGFNNHARSFAKAVGPWQFMAPTGKRYGLMVNWWVDERRDTRKSTIAAIEYLKDLYGFFQSWELAAAAYNAGEAKIARAIRRFGSKDFWVLARHRFLRPETRDYVPKIIAAAIVAKNRTQFGFPPSSQHPASGEAVAGDGEIVRLEPETGRGADEGDSIESVLRANLPGKLGSGPIDSEGTPGMGNDYEETPEYARDLSLGIPALAQAPVSKGPVPLAKVIATPAVNKKGEIFGEEIAEFEVQSPADLLKVARAAGLSYPTVKALNPELLRWCTPPTVSSYRLKLPVSSKERFLASYNHPAYPRQVQFISYRTRGGESLGRIARNFGLKTDPLVDLNGISPKAGIRGGVRVLLPMPNDPSRSIASLEVRDPAERRRGYRTRQKVSFKRREAARSSRRYGG